MNRTDFALLAAGLVLAGVAVFAAVGIVASVRAADSAAGAAVAARSAGAASASGVEVRRADLGTEWQALAIGELIDKNSNVLPASGLAAPEPIVGYVDCVLDRYHRAERSGWSWFDRWFADDNVYTTVGCLFGG